MIDKTPENIYTVWIHSSVSQMLLEYCHAVSKLTKREISYADKIRLMMHN